MAWHAGMRARPFHTSRSVLALDFYAILRIPRNASKAQVKSQFYKLSKQYHPDVSKSEEGKMSFQQVSEAYATLSNDRKRREYDQKIAFEARGSTAPAYDPGDAMRRRTTANYAWEYTTRMKKEAGKNHTPHGAQQYAPPPQAPGSAAHHFTRMAEREARREEARARSPYSGSSFNPHANPDSFRSWSHRRWGEEGRQAELINPMVRFLQVAAVFGGAVWLSTKILS
ncbi:peroxisome-assembly ATPase [Malassezia vespertilionis]|uniref:J domain-containing protein n=1 Tax=Malassezia vespertilionis TaxID=2020962 RepID=A0A2N1JAQ1_9BASI|nr:peroxisome-assembly ATPase [Malassezia vespertilionis]PKI83631.1 hypothetical protein MVES_002333 [Malassezia vespertilionis]WFD07112.1 peroxisome-assembly ATPase [Malassezia vespertilionis]